MSNLKIVFENSAWLLLLIIPALALAFWPYFRSAKKYRHTRNRVISLVLQICIGLLVVTVLSGATLVYAEPNTTNEVIFLVDMSYSNRDSELKKNSYIKTILEKTNEGFMTGIVMFGKEPIEAVKLSSDTKKVYEEYNAVYKQYIADGRIYDNATNIAEALNFACNLFSKTDTSKKIVLISDGIQTDGDALYAILHVASRDIRVDTVLFSDEYGDEVAILGVEFPDYNIEINNDIIIKITVQSNYGGMATITLHDIGIAADEIKGEEMKVLLQKGKISTFDYVYAFKTSGSHEVFFEIECSHSPKKDTIQQNNFYYSYLNIQVFDKILMIERENEAQFLAGLIQQEYKDEYNIKIEKISDISAVDINDHIVYRERLNAIREYDQVILFNIANEDMPTGFDQLLNEYVSVYGGGLFTVGGNKPDAKDEDGNPVPNAYNRKDMAGTLYQRMLPVDAITYTPPLGLIIIIDISGSMLTDLGAVGTAVDLAKQGAEACVEALTDRDWCGVVSLESRAVAELELTPGTQKQTIVRAIRRLGGGGGTLYREALIKAGELLKANSKIQKRHIMFVSDGEPNENLGRENPNGYQRVIEDNYKEAGITLSFVLVGGSAGGLQVAEEMAELGGNGRVYNSDTAPDMIPRYMREELNIKEIKAVEMDPYTPTIGSPTGAVNGLLPIDGIKPEDWPILKGFYGTRIKNVKDSPVTVVLAGPYTVVPIYAQWNYGKGKVGSFMCDLNNVWSEAFLSNETKLEDGSVVNIGLTFINNVIKGLFPSEPVRSREIEAEIQADNFSRQVNITKIELSQGETVHVTITGPPDPITNEAFSQEAKAEASLNTARCTFFVSYSGVYEVMIQKWDKNNNPVGVPEYFYTTFSYSQEYNVFIDPDQPIEFLKELARRGNGKTFADDDFINALGTEEQRAAFVPVSQTAEIFNGFELSSDRVFDPRIPFIITAIVLFLLDIAVRKFKFKWPWEIVRDRRSKRLLKQTRD